MCNHWSYKIDHFFVPTHPYEYIRIRDRRYFGREDINFNNVQRFECDAAIPTAQTKETASLPISVLNGVKAIHSNYILLENL